MLCWSRRLEKCAWCNLIYMKVWLKMLEVLRTVNSLMVVDLTCNFTKHFLLSFHWFLEISGGKALLLGTQLVVSSFMLTKFMTRVTLQQIPHNLYTVALNWPETSSASFRQFVQLQECSTIQISSSCVETPKHNLVKVKYIRNLIYMKVWLKMLEEIRYASPLMMVALIFQINTYLLFSFHYFVKI